MSETTSIRLKRIMEERNLKQSDILAKAQPFCEKYNVKLGKSDLSQFVSGKVTPGQWKLTILGLALNVSEAWLMGLDVPMERTQSSEKIEADAQCTAEFEMLVEKYRALDEHGKEMIDTVLDLEYRRCKSQIYRPVQIAARGGKTMDVSKLDDKTDLSGGVITEDL